MAAKAWVMIFVMCAFAGAQSGAAIAQTASQDCIDLATSKTVTFSGRLTHKVFPGPPNFESVRQGDKPEGAYILTLAAPVCVQGARFLAERKSIGRVQVFPAEPDDKAVWKALKASVGKRVAVEGSEAFGEFTGHHHAPLLLPITKIAPAGKAGR